MGLAIVRLRHSRCEATMKLPRILRACRIDKPERCRLADHDPSETFGLSTNIEDARPILAEGVARLGELQQRL